MELISEKIVEKTWKEVAGIMPGRARKEMKRLGQSQPDLLAFVMESTGDLGLEIQELANYLFFVVFRMFQASGTKIRKITSREITECYNKNENLLERFISRDKLRDPLTIFPVLSQPFVMKYVSEAIMEEDEDSPILDEEEKGALFLILKTVVEALDKAA